MRSVWLVIFALATTFTSQKIFVYSQTSSSLTDDLYLEGRPSGNFPIDDEDGDFGSGSGSGSGDYGLSDVVKVESTMVGFLVNVSATTLNEETFNSEPQPTSASYILSKAVTSHDPPTTVDVTTTPYLHPEEEKEHGEEVGLEGTKEPTVDPTSDWEKHSTEQSSASSYPNKFTSTMVYEDILLPEEAGDITLSEERQNPVIVDKVGHEILAKSSHDKLNKFGTTEQVTSENLWERTEVLAAVITCGIVGLLCAIFLLMLLAYRMKKKDEGSYDLGDTKLSTTAYHKAPTNEFYA